MTMICITFRSITFAQRGERTLHKGGVDAVLQRTPRWMETRGCGYCLRLRPGTEARALALLRQDGVPFNKLFVQNQDGSVEELSP